MFVIVTKRGPPSSTPPDTLFPYPTLFRASRGRRIFLLSAALLGCMTAVGPTRAASLTVEESNRGLVSGYQVAAGDRLRITVFDEPTLTGDYEIGDDGAVAYPLIDPVEASGDRKSTRLNSSH